MVRLTESHTGIDSNLPPSKSQGHLEKDAKRCSVALTNTVTGAVDALQLVSGENCDDVASVSAQRTSDKMYTSQPHIPCSTARSNVFCDMSADSDIRSCTLTLCILGSLRAHTSCGKSKIRAKASLYDDGSRDLVRTCVVFEHRGVCGARPWA